MTLRSLVPNGRNLKRWYLKLARQDGSPEFIAKGCAIGLFIGFFMPFGCQLVVAIPLAFMLKASKLLSAAFTLVTNPYTITFIYPLQCMLGGLLIGEPLSYGALCESFRGLLKEPSFKELFDLGSDIVIPFFVGGTFLAVVSSASGYFVSLRMVRRYRERRLRRASASGRAFASPS